MTEPVDKTRRVSPRNAILLGIAGCLGVLLLVDSVVLSGNLEAFWTVLHGEQLHAAEDQSISPVEAFDELGGIVVALLALTCAAAAGRREVGLTWGSAPRQVRLLGDWMLVLGIVMTVALFAVTQLVALAGGKGVGNDNLDLDAIPTWFLVLKSINAGLTEEIIVVAIAWRLMEFIPTRTGKATFVMTGAATVILVLLRVSYHLYMGLPVLFIVVLGYLTVRFYRHTRNVGTLIVVHVLWDILETTRISPIPAEVWFVFLGGLLAWMLTTGPAPAGPHFGFAFGREHETPTGHLPYQFTWHKSQAPSTPPSTSPSSLAPEPAMDQQRQDSDR